VPPTHDDQDEPTARPDDHRRAARAPTVPTPVPPLARTEQRLLVGAGVLILLVVLVAAVAGSSRDDGDAGAAPPTNTAQAAASSTVPTGPAPLRQPTTPPTGVVADPDDLTVLIDRERRLPPGFRPADLVEAPVPFTFENPDDKRLLRRETGEALAGLFDAATADELPLRAVSGFRSEESQRDLHANYVAQDGAAAADRYSARPGHSEHQTGLAIDVTSFDGACPAERCFGDRPEATWVADHAHEHGFIVRYPADAEPITGYSYEPWHLRYVGTELATELHERGLTLDEWYGAGSG